ncbi:MAG: hypothetical protein ACR5LF_12675 [Symbiopectobacterium sp.]
MTKSLSKQATINYVGPVFGQHAYAEHANTSLAAYNIMTTAITYYFYHNLLA